MDLFVFCMTCLFRGVGLCEASEADCLQDRGDAEFSRELIAAPYESMAAACMSQVLAVKSKLNLCCCRAEKGCVGRAARAMQCYQRVKLLDLESEVRVNSTCE